MYLNVVVYTPAVDTLFELSPPYLDSHLLAYILSVCLKLFEAPKIYKNYDKHTLHTSLLFIFVYWCY